MKMLKDLSLQRIHLKSLSIFGRRFVLVKPKLGSAMLSHVGMRPFANLCTVRMFPNMVNMADEV